MKIILSSILFLIGVSKQQLTQQSCFSCARSSNYLCNNPNQFKNPWNVQCCYPGTGNPECNKKGSICSPDFYKSPADFYSQCPLQNKQTCGLKSNYDELNIYAMKDKNSFQFERLRYKTQKWKIPSYSACSYQVMIPPSGYKSGKLFIKFDKIEEGVTLYLNSNDPTFVEIQITSRVNQLLYSIDNDKSFRVTAVPALNSYNTAYSFDYWNDGQKNLAAAIWAKLAAHKLSLLPKVEKKSALHKLVNDNLEIVIGTVAGVLLLVICCCTIRFCRNKKKNEQDENKVIPFEDLNNNTKDEGTSQFLDQADSGANLYKTGATENSDADLTKDPFTTIGQKQTQNLQVRPKGVELKQPKPRNYGRQKPGKK